MSSKKQPIHVIHNFGDIAPDRKSLDLFAGMVKRCEEADDIDYTRTSVKLVLLHYPNLKNTVEFKEFAATHGLEII